MSRSMCDCDLNAGSVCICMKASGGAIPCRPCDCTYKQVWCADDTVKILDKELRIEIGEMQDNRYPAKNPKWRDAFKRLPKARKAVLLCMNSVMVTASIKDGQWRSSWTHEPIQLSEGAKWRKLPKKPS